MCSSPGPHYYIIAHFTLGQIYMHKLLILLLSIKCHVSLIMNFEKNPFFLLPILRAVDIFKQGIYRRMKIIYINIDMLLFSCRSRMVFKLGRITKQSWRVLCSSLKRQCFCSGKRQRSKSRNILGITKKILRGYIFKLFWIYILPFCPGFFRQPLRKKLKISISFWLH